MVGIVIVSHSEKLAAGVQELAQQMVRGTAQCAVAAGIDDPENPFGTDAMKIHQAIASVYSDRGVVVLMDMGSAVLSAEMALEFLPEDQREKVRLCEAPLVEGTIAAVVQAANGADIEQVMAEARGALAAKAAQLSTEELNVGRLKIEGSQEVEGSQELESWKVEKLERSEQPSNPEQPSTLEVHLTVQNQMGLHARPAARFVSAASRYESQITLQNVTANSKSVNAKSINQVITLGVRQGHEIAIAATGTDATEALAALQQLVEANFGEGKIDLTPPAPLPTPLVPPDAGGGQRTKPFFHGRGENYSPLLAGEGLGERSTESCQLFGIPASPGIAIGTVVKYQPTVFAISQQQADNPEVEWQELQVARATVREQIQRLRQKAATRREEDAAIFEAHLLVLEDPAILDNAHKSMFVNRLGAAAAWQAAIDETIATYQNLDDSYLKARAIDVYDVGQQVLQLLTGTESTPLDLKEPAILVATDLTPSQTVQLDSSKVLGICTIAGSTTSHSGILARSLGIPAVVGVSEALLHLKDGILIALDGETGNVWVQPDEARVRELQAKRDRHLAALKEHKAATRQPAVTRDGHHVKVMANIGGVADALVAVENGAEGVGLLRSEFLYLEREIAPTEEEQVEVIASVASTVSPSGCVPLAGGELQHPASPHPLIIRALDIGGDKPLPYLNLRSEANPFLGWRGIRVLLDYPDLLKTQLRAILRVSDRHPIKVMFPLVASISEVRAAKEILATAQSELRQAGIPFDEEMEVGIMVEVPAAVAIADQLAEEVDFFSIGTNDLSQYVMAADRTNPKVAPLADAFAPAVLRMIQQTVKAAHQAGIWVGVCGELASFPLATPILVGLGVDELSMNPQAIPAVKAAISQLTLSEAEAIASAMLHLDSAEAVRQYVAAW